MKDWERIRANRDDLTDYVIHFTRHRVDRVEGRFQHATARDVLVEILNSGYIRPTFAARANTYSSTRRATVKGPYPAVCLTEQPLWAVARSREVLASRYSGYGIAYHKYLLFGEGGRSVLYSNENCLGRRLQPDEPGWEDGKDVFTGGLPADLQYLWVNYKPGLVGSGEFPIDFTWEREWRIRPRGLGLPVYLGRPYYPGLRQGALLVEKDADVPWLRSQVASYAATGVAWAKAPWPIISLQTVRGEVAKGETAYGKVDTWPDTAASVPEEPPGL